jgi:antitoxin ParD1/3/4
MANIEKVSISLPREMMDDIRDAVEDGAYATTSEALRDAVRVWQKQRAASLDRITPKSFADLKRMVEEGARSMERGELKPAAEVFDRLEAKYRAMAKARKKRSR